MTQSYQHGLINGWLDAYLGLSLITTLFSDDLSYALGYREGRKQYIEGDPLHTLGKT